MRPLDHKLKYQIDKLLRTAATGSLGKISAMLCNELFDQLADFFPTVTNTTTLADYHI